MKKMKEIVQVQRGDLLYVGCHAHWMNLAAKDVIEDSGIIDKVNNILKFFRCNHKAHAGIFFLLRSWVHAPFFFAQLSAARDYLFHLQPQTLAGPVITRSFNTTINIGASWPMCVQLC